MSNIHTNIHTAGPWLLRKNVSGHWAIANGGWGKQFAGVKHAEQGYTSEELAANARLMTAAPDLLAAAELVVENWEKNLTQPMAELTFAIKKAKGELRARFT